MEEDLGQNYSLRKWIGAIRRDPPCFKGALWRSVVIYVPMVLDQVIEGFSEMGLGFLKAWPVGLVTFAVVYVLMLAFMSAGK